MKLKVLIVNCLVFMLLGIHLQAQNKPKNKKSKMENIATAPISKNHTLIDRALIFGNPEIASGQLSPNGQMVSFLKEYQGIMNIWVKKYDEPFEKAKVLTLCERPVGGYFWSNDSKYILYIKDNKGDENFHIYSVSPHELPEKETGVARNLDLTPKGKITAQIYSVSKKTPNILFIGLNDRDESWHDLYKLEITTGSLEKMFENKIRITNYIFDWEEHLRIITTSDETSGNTIFWSVDEDKKTEQIYENNLKENAYITGWTEDNTECYLVSNKGDVNLSTLYLLNPNTKSVNLVESDPLSKVDFGGLFIDENSKKIINTRYLDDKIRRYWKDKEWEKDHQWLESQFVGKEVGYSSFTTDYNKTLVTISSDASVPEIYLFDRKTKELTFQYTPRPALKPFEHLLSNMTSISYKSSDGLLIPAYLTMPTHIKTGKVPLVALIHGGPKGPRDIWGYDGEAQFLANRGYAVLQPNFRASGGFGKKFLNGGDMEWGKLMQDDITFGVKHLIDKGIVDKDRVAIMGSSYGGYATLAGLTFTPNLYNCGVDIVGPSNLFTLIESIPAYWEAGRKWLYEMIGDPNTEDGKKHMTETSPLFNVDKIVKPLLVVQGANDPRVKQAEADQIVVAVRDKGKDVEYILADDEGHGFHKPINNMAMFAAIEKFLALQLKGEYQKDMPALVEKRLKEITKNVSQVTYNPKENLKISKVNDIKNDLQEQTLNYQVSISVMGKNIEMDVEKEWTKLNNFTIITEKFNSPIYGEGSDETVLNDKLQAMSRKTSQGGMVMDLKLDDSKLTIKNAENEFTEAMPNGLVLDGAHLEALLPRLGLKVNENIVVNVFEATIQKTLIKTITFLGIEGDMLKYEVQGFDIAKDKATYWFDPKDKTLIKSIAVKPLMGNAEITITKK